MKRRLRLCEGERANLDTRCVGVANNAWLWRNQENQTRRLFLESGRRMEGNRSCLARQESEQYAPLVRQRSVCKCKEAYWQKTSADELGSELLQELGSHQVDDRKRL